MNRTNGTSTQSSWNIIVNLLLHTFRIFAAIASTPGVLVRLGGEADSLWVSSTGNGIVVPRIWSIDISSAPCLL